MSSHTINRKNTDDNRKYYFQKMDAFLKDMSRTMGSAAPAETTQQQIADFFDFSYLAPNVDQKLMNDSEQPLMYTTEIVPPRPKYEELPALFDQQRQPHQQLQQQHNCSMSPSLPVYRNEDKENKPEPPPFDGLNNIGHWQNAMYASLCDMSPSLVAPSRQPMRSVQLSGSTSAHGGNGLGSVPATDSSAYYSSSQGSAESQDSGAINHNNPIFASMFDGPSFMPEWSPKVFLGGLPQDISVDEMRHQLQRFGKVAIDWPHRDKLKDDVPPHGFAFAVFSERGAVESLLKQCVTAGDRVYLMMYSVRIKTKQVQVRPWRCADANWENVRVLQQGHQINDRWSVFIGGLPRTIRAEELAAHFESRWPGVLSVRIDVDSQHGYPKGSARVNFYDPIAFMNAMQGKYIELKGVDFPPKMAEIKAYICDDMPCDQCRTGGGQKTFFCGQPGCLKYLCTGCWSKVHVPGSHIQSHTPTMKNREGRRRGGSISSSVPAGGAAGGGGYDTTSGVMYR